MEMAFRVGAVRSPATNRKRATATPGGAFGVRKAVFAVGGMSSSARRRLMERFRSELAAVRGLLERAKEFLAPEAGRSGVATATASSSSPAARCGEDRRFLDAGRPRSAAPVEPGGENPAKRRKVSPLVELKQQLGKSTDGRSHHGHEATDASGVIHPSPRHRQDGGKVAVDIGGEVISPVATTLSSLLPEYSELVDATVVHLLSPLQRRYIALAEDADICGGVAPIAPSLSALPPEYSELVDATGVHMLSPLQDKYVALAAEENDDEYVDICGDASPVIMVHKNLGEVVINITSSSSSPSSSSTSDSTSDSDTSSESDSDSDSGSASGESAGSPAPAVPPNASVSSAEPLEPAPSEVAQSARQDKVADVERAAAAPARPLTDLIASAQGALARRRQEETAQAREKARQELAEMERAALASDVIHPLDMKLLGIAAVEHAVSSGVENTSLLRELGLFLKADDEEQEWESIVVGGGADDDVEEGEIR